MNVKISKAFDVHTDLQYMTDDLQVDLAKKRTACITSSNIFSSIL